MPRFTFSFTGRILMGFGLFFVCGCNFDYYLHLARGQSQIFLNRTAISELYARTDLDDKTRKQFALIESILDYARSVGLATGDNYTAYFDTGDQPVSWNVSASPPYIFEPYLWDFPFVGSVPYKGFFDRQRAVVERDGLIARGFDAIVRPVSAYSTLGFFSDPVLSAMLDYPPDQLADLILHELTHATAYAEGQADFNETMATFVGRRGSLLFLAHHYGPDTPHLLHATQRRSDSTLFRSFMTETVAALDSLYSQDLDREVVLQRRTTVFARRKKDFEAIRGQFIRYNYDGFLQWEINNARLLSYRRYNYDLGLFNAVFEQRDNDLSETIQQFVECADADDPWACIRSAAAPTDPNAAL